MKRKTAPQIEWERLKPGPGEWLPVRGWTPNDPKTAKVKLTRRQFNRLWQLAYRRGMTRAADVAGYAGKLSSRIFSQDWKDGRDASASRIRRFIEEGAKDE